MGVITYPCMYWNSTMPLKGNLVLVYLIGYSFCHDKLAAGFGTRGTWRGGHFICGSTCRWDVLGGDPPQYPTRVDIYIKIRRCRHFDEVVVIGCTGSCQNTNFQYYKWQKNNQNDDIFVSLKASVFYKTVTSPYPHERPFVTTWTRSR